MSVNMFTTSLFVKAYILTLSLKLNDVVPSLNVDYSDKYAT